MTVNGKNQSQFWLLRCVRTTIDGKKCRSTIFCWAVAGVICGGNMSQMGVKKLHKSPFDLVFRKP